MIQRIAFHLAIVCCCCWLLAVSGTVAPALGAPVDVQPATESEAGRAAPSVGAERARTPNDTQKQVRADGPAARPLVALALGGGGMRGAAHIGVLRVFEREGIPIDHITGSSMGSIIGGLYCAGVPLDDIEAALADRSLHKAYAPAYVVKMILSPLVKVKGFLFPRGRPLAGLVSSERFEAFIREMLPGGPRRVEELRSPSFCAVGTSLVDGQSHRLTQGDLCQVIAASAALPPIMRPVPVNGDLFVDGGVRANVPVVAARQSGAQLVIAVRTDERLVPVDAEKFVSYRVLANRMASIVNDVSYHRNGADLIIYPDVTGINLLSKRRIDVESAVRAGEVAAEEALPAIKELLKQLDDDTRRAAAVPRQKSIEGTSQQPAIR